MGTRLDLQTLLEGVLGSEAVYFQPPPTVTMTYPCIVFQRTSAQTIFANDKPYGYSKQYQVTVIDRNPDSTIPDNVAALPQCIFDRHFTKDNLNHDVFNIYF